MWSAPSLRRCSSALSYAGTEWASATGELTAALCLLGQRAPPCTAAPGREKEQEATLLFIVRPPGWSMLESRPLVAVHPSGQCRLAFLLPCRLQCFSHCVFCSQSSSFRSDPLPLLSTALPGTVKRFVFKALEHMLMWFPPIGFLSPLIQIHSEYHT